MRIVYLFSIAVFFCCCTCGGNDVLSDAEVISVDSDVVVGVDSLFEDIRIVPLQSDCVLLGGIERIIPCGDYIVVADYHYSKAVAVYDRSGSLKSVIKRPGRGEQEYATLDYVTVTPDRKQIVLYSNQQNKILFYDLDGKFVKSVAAPFYFIAMEYLDNGVIAFATYNMSGQPVLENHGQGKNLIVFTDADFNIISGAMPRIHNENYYSSTPDFYTRADEVYTNQPYCDTVYRVRPNGIVPAYVLDLRHIGGFANFGPDAVWTDVSEMMKEKPMFAGIDAVGEEYLLYSISNPSEADKRGGKYLYSKNTRTNYKINTAVEDWNAMGFFKSLLGIKAADDGNTFIGSVPVSFILMCLDNDMRSSYEPLRNLTEESNPVLVFYTLRPGL